jgi:hypothetical protein
LKLRYHFVLWLLLTTIVTGLAGWWIGSAVFAGYGIGLITWFNYQEKKGKIDGGLRKILVWSVIFLGFIFGLIGQVVF